MARSKGTIWIVDESNGPLPHASFDRPGAVLACYLVREIPHMNWSLAIRAVGAVIHHAGKWFDRRHVFTRAVMAFKREIYDFDLGLPFREMLIGEKEEEQLKPTDFDVVVEQETLTDSQEDQFLLEGSDADAAWVKALLKVPHAERRELLDGAGVTEMQRATILEISSGVPRQGRLSRNNKGTSSRSHPNSVEGQQQFFVAASAKIATWAAAVAKSLAEAAENISTQFKNGHVCQVPCPHIAFTMKTAKVIDVDKLVVQLCSTNEQLTLEDRSEMQLSRCTTRTLSQMGIHDIRHPQSRTSLKKAEKWQYVTCAGSEGTNKFQVHDA